jgi:hypothetical protein
MFINFEFRELFWLIWRRVALNYATKYENQDQRRRARGNAAFNDRATRNQRQGAKQDTKQKGWQKDKAQTGYQVKLGQEPNKETDKEIKDQLIDLQK